MTNVSLPDYHHWKSQVKCQAACPVNTDARSYVRAIAEGDEELAYLIARGPNPLASICGRVCGAPCESACRRGDIDDPISIKSLKRYVCEKFGAESNFAGTGSLVTLLKRAAKRQAAYQCSGEEELLPLLQSLLDGKIKIAEGKSVGIIGSGPAGLAAAHDLALLGFSVTIYEMEPVLAGMLATGVPEYRLPRDLIRIEVGVILEMGVEAKTNCCVGRDVTLPELRKRHDAVIIAVGAKRSRELKLPGAGSEGVIGGIEFLRNISLGERSLLGEKVVVIGGGNVAYDVGRTVLRQIAMDAARSARRVAGVSEVFLCSLESLEEMPADDIEIIEGDEEGIIRRNSLGPVEILADSNGSVFGVRFQKCTRVYDEEHKFAPEFDSNDITDISCDTVLIAIGQSFDISFVDPERDGLELTDFGSIKCDAETGVTSSPDVFVIGDLAYGPKLLIHAVASGKKVARNIYEQLTGYTLETEFVELHFPIPGYRREPGYETVQRVRPPTNPITRRLEVQGSEVERVYTQENAIREASRCLDCGVNTIFDGSLCILCGGCVDVCPEICLKLIPLEKLSGSVDFESLKSERLEENSGIASAIIKNDDICIRCGLCADRCPTGAITMERFIFKETFKCA